MEDLRIYYAMVDEVIHSFGVDPAVCRGEKPGNWKLFKGSAEVWIDIWHIEAEGRGYFQVVAPVMMVPEIHREAFYKELLELSDTMFGAAFTIDNNRAYIKAIREVEHLDITEVTATLNRVGSYADDYDDMLKTKYGAPPIAGAPPTAR